MIRYNFVKYKVLQFVESIQFPLRKFPIDMVSVIKTSTPIKLWSYQYYAECFSCDLKEVYEFCESDSGCLKYDTQDKIAIILFNKSQSDGRVRWTLAHELGHYVLEHYTLDMPNEELDSEADYFAAMLLAPPPILDSQSVKSPSDVEEYCGLTFTASQVRYKEYLDWKAKNYKTRFSTEICKLFYDSSENHNSGFKRLIT